MKGWQKVEHAVCKTLGGQLVAGSGCSPMGGRGDVRAGRYLVEVKSTVTGRFRVTQRLLDKTAKRAVKDGREPALVVTGKRSLWAIVPVQDDRAWIKKLFKPKGPEGIREKALAFAARDGIRMETQAAAGMVWTVLPLSVFAQVIKLEGVGK